MPKKGLKVLEQMRRSQANWTRRDLDNLYEHFGFEIRHGSSHDIVRHSQFPLLRDTLPRHKEIGKAYIKNAIELIDQLIAIRGADALEMEENDEPKSP